MSNEQAAKKFEVGEAVVLVDHGYSRSYTRVLSARVAKVGRRWVTVDHAGYTDSQFDAVTGLVKYDGIGAGERQRILRPEDWEAEQEEREARKKLNALGVTLEERRVPKVLTNKAVWEALRGLVEQS